MGLAVALKLLAALMLAFVWAAYLRKINIFSRIKWIQVIIPIIVGGLTTLVAIFFDLPELISLDKKYVTFQKLIYYLYNVGLMEELCKYGGLLLMMAIFHKWFREEPNYIIYAALVALGFATIENFKNFYLNGVSSIYMRGMLSTVNHIVWTSIISGFMVVGLRKNIGRAILYAVLGILISTFIHGLSDFLMALGEIPIYIFMLLIFVIQIEVWARILNNFLNFSKKIDLKKSIDRNTLQRFLLISFFIAGTIQLIGLIDEVGWHQGILQNLNLLTQEVIITIILIVRITRFTIIPRYWKPVYPVLPIVIRRGKFQRSIIPTSPRFFLKIRGDEFNEYPFTSLIDHDIKLRSLPSKEVDFELEVNAKMIEKKFMGPKNDLYYLCEILDFHTIHPQYNSRFVLVRPKNYGKRSYNNIPILGLIALKGFVDLNNIGPKDCKFISWMGMKKAGEKTRSQRLLDILR